MRILFQGDSVTDTGKRDRTNDSDLGDYGYVYYAAKLLREKYPEIDFEFLNRGICGDETEQLVARWPKDALELQPDIISILVGINDTWHHHENNGFISDAYFEANYRQILTATKERTHAKILMIEPFLLPMPNTVFSSEPFRCDLDHKITVVRRLATEFADVYLPLDGLMNAQLVRGKTYADFTIEGVHPQNEGPELIAKYYVEAISPLIEEVRAGK